MKLIPVIHLPFQEVDRVVQSEIEHLIEHGVPQAFLIDHYGRDNLLQGTLRRLLIQYPDFNFGANYLSFSAPIALQAAMELNLAFVWTDNFGLGDPNIEKQLSEILNLRTSNRPLHFGGFDFKGQIAQKAEESILALPFIDVLTTSGPRTGTPPNPQKIKSLRQFIPHTPIAVASGLSSENIGTFSGLIDYALTATSINTNDRLDPQKLTQFITVMRSLS